MSIPKRFREVITWKGPIDTEFMEKVAVDYQNAVRKLADTAQQAVCS